MICRRTVSLLPSFAQSYRLLETRLVEAFFLGEILEARLERWQPLLTNYGRRARRFAPQLIAILGTGLGVAPPEPSHLPGWLARLCGGLGPATEQLVNRWAVTVFGQYRCHQRGMM